MTKSYEEILSERREKLEKQADAIGYSLDYEPKVLCEDIRALPDSFWHENRTKGWGGSNEGALNGISKYSSLPEIVNEKLLGRKAPVDDDKQFIFDVGHAMEWVMLKRYAALNGYKFLTYTDYFVITRSKEDVTVGFPWMKKAQEGVYSFVTRDRQQAESLLCKVKKDYADSFIAEQESNDPKDVRDITAEEHAKFDQQGIVCVDRRQYINPNYPSMIGDMDGLCIEPGGVTKRGLECKTYTHKAPKGCFTSGVLGETGTIKNEEYRYQVAHYMAVCNIDRFDILACCGNTPDDFTITTVYRDVEFEKYICENAQECWDKYIEEMDTPEVTEISEEQNPGLVYSISADKLSDDMIEIPDSLLSEIEKIEKINERIKMKEQEIKALEDQVRAVQVPIEEIMSANNRGYMITSHPYDYEFEFKPSNGRSSFDQKTLKANMPDIWEKFKQPAKQGERKFKFFRTSKRSV